MRAPSPTYQETVDAIEDTLFTPDSSGRNRFERELDSHVSKRIGRWIISGGLIIVLSGAGLYFSLENRVSNMEEKQNASDVRIDKTLSEIKTDISTVRDLLIEVIRKGNQN